MQPPLLLTTDIVHKPDKRHLVDAIASRTDHDRPLHQQKQNTSTKIALWILSNLKLIKHQFCIWQLMTKQTWSDWFWEDIPTESRSLAKSAYTKELCVVPPQYHDTL